MSWYTPRPAGSGSGNGNGYGYGSGSGSGYGSGYSSGPGSGDGDGDGDGSGNGFGDGSGNGYGYSSGSGSGDGFGSGSGYGSGHGDGYGMLKHNGNGVSYIDGIPTCLLSTHGDTARGYIINKDLTTSPCFVVRGHGLYAHGETLRAAQQALEKKILDNMPVEEKVAAFWKTFSRGVRYPAMEFFSWHNTLTGSCEMGRRKFMRDHDISESDEFTVEEFIELTKGSYGSNVIKMLEESQHE